MSTPQLAHWAGQFGNEYIVRNEVNEQQINQGISFWTKILGLMTDSPNSILEVGANIGRNLHAIDRICAADLFAVEPNEQARNRLIESGIVGSGRVLAASAQKIPLPDSSVDLAFTCGVLIHIHPDDLLSACSEIRRCARKYIFCAEYFSDEPEEKKYRGNDGLLFKRDFGAFWLDNFSDLQIVNYGFSWRRAGEADNMNWWLFRRQLS